VALAPVLEANISAIMDWHGVDFSSLASSMVTVAQEEHDGYAVDKAWRDKPERNMKGDQNGNDAVLNKSGYQEAYPGKNPAAPIPSTMTIIPPMRSWSAS